MCVVGGCNGPTAQPAVPCSTDIECIGTPMTPMCDPAGDTCMAGAARSTLIGAGDGTAASVTLTSMFDMDKPRAPWGMAFNPKRPTELWIVNHLDNTTVTVYDPGTPQIRSEVRKDPAAGHFMAKPPGIAFSDNDTFAVCGDGNGGNDFMGPAVFSTDPAIYAKATPGGLGSHLDMLHASPFCMGIANEKGNAYWLFDGQNSALARYDFKEFHPPGEDDHSDGEIMVYVEGQVKRVAGVPSHLVFNPADSQLYVADTGNKRVVKLDTKSGTVGDTLPSKEPSIPMSMNGATLVDFVPSGTLQAPSGIAINAGILYVSDNATGRVSAYDLTTGRLVRYLDTGLSAGSLGELVVAPDGKLWILDMVAAKVLRIDAL